MRSKFIFVLVKRPKVFIITGKQGEGKTTCLQNILGELQQANVSLAGFIAEGVWENEKRSKFFIQDVNSKARKLLCQNIQNENYLNYGRFYFDPEAISFGEELLDPESVNSIKIIDEVGLFELKGNVWASAMRKLLAQDDVKMIITVRDSFVDQVISGFDLHDAEVIHASLPAMVVAERIIKQID